MKIFISLAAVCALVALVSMPAYAESGVSQSVAVGARFHSDNKPFGDLPFDSGDMTYSAAFEWHEQDAYWQVCLGYTMNPKGTNDVDYVLTPEINLMVKDSYWRGGIGAVWSYLERKNGSPHKSDWLDVYWQMIFGFSMPLGGMHLDLMAYYVFQDWDKLDQFDLNDIEFGALLGFDF